MQDSMHGDLSPAMATPPLQYASEVSAFVKPERKKELAEYAKTTTNSTCPLCKADLEQRGRCFV